jgi:hypothetical protein
MKSTSQSIFPNLDAEQARRGVNNRDIAQMLGCSRQTYEYYKTTGLFKLPHINSLLDFFACDYNYLFSESAIPTKSA